jgi:hypothetical protein
VFCVHTCSAFWKGAAHVMLCMLRRMCSECTVLCYHSRMHSIAPACGTVEREHPQHCARMRNSNEHAQQNRGCLHGMA